MIGRELLRILGKDAGRRLVDALGGEDRPGYALRLDNNNAFSRAEVEVCLSQGERSDWTGFSSRLSKALGSPRGLDALDAPHRLRLRIEEGLVVWVKPVNEGRPAAFGRKSLGDPQLDSILKTVDRLHKINGVSAEPGRLEFRFSRPVPWPLFSILEFSRAFQPAAAEWARRVGTSEVRSFGLGAGVMDVELV